MKEFDTIIEIPQNSKVKYEFCQNSNRIRVDRILSSAYNYPYNYGFIPQTYCGTRVKDLSPKSKRGDGDPLDICVVTERPINRSEVILSARVIGGFYTDANRNHTDRRHHRLLRHLARFLVFKIPEGMAKGTILNTRPKDDGSRLRFELTFEAFPQLCDLWFRPDVVR